MGVTIEDSTDRLAVAAVVSRYHRTERAVSWTLALLVAALCVAALVRLSLLPGVLVVVGILVLARGPVVRRSGTTRLRTDRDLESVRFDFTSPKPPILALQWGVADDVTPTANGATYAYSYLFGIRSATLTLEVRSGPDRQAMRESEGVHGGDALELEGTVNGRPWGTYRLALESTDGRTLLDVEMTTDKRVGLVALAQAAVARRYYADALAAQGYTVLEHEASLSV